MNRFSVSIPLALALALPVADSAGQSVTHRWTFNDTGAATHGTVIPDALSSAPATIVGTGAVRGGGAVTLPGTSGGNVAASSISAYLDLPNGIVSSKTDMSVEIWATIVSSKNWQRLFDFGRMNTSGTGEVGNNSGAPGAGTNSSDNLMLALQRGGALNDQRFAARLDGATEIQADTTTATATGTQYHFVATFQAGVGAHAGTGGRFTWYRNGVQIAFLDTNFRLSQIEDVNNWLGRSQFTGDSNSNVTYNEVRLYDYALSPTQISANTTSGPDANFPAPTVAGDSVTMLHGQKARIQVLANDSGEIVPSTLTIVTPPAHGTASVSSDGSILYTHDSGAPETDSFIYQVSNSTGQSSQGTVDVTFSSGLKIPAASVAVPAAPPATAYTLPNALGSLTFSQPLCVATPPGETQRLFVCEKGGLLKVVPDVTAATPTSSTFLNLPAVLSSRGEAINTSSESGLLGLAFHPNYATNRYFYIFYSVTKSGQLYQRVSRFTAQAGDPNAADTASELILIEQLDDYGNHNGGDLHFGPDGFLYITVGDEGNANDNPTFNSQLINKDLFSGILRIDVDRDMANSVEPTSHASIPTDAGTARFAIPKTNPFVVTALGGDWDGTYNGSAVTGTVRREFWATGLRNPWRISFDPATGTLWCGDVGQGAREEIDIIVRGGNYGWVYREGTLTGPRTTNPTMPADFDTLYHTPPVHEYPRSEGYSVTGGRVYRGTGIGALVGKYIFADYGSGNIWSMNLDGSNVQRLLGEAGIVAFGVDPSNQDLLMADYGDGVIRRLVSATNDTGFPQTLSATGVFADLSDLSPAPGVTPYDVNLPFWSDHALKRRWFSVPDAASRFTPSEDGLWGLPDGAVWVKHFDMEMQRGVPESRKRIETRLLVKTPGGAYGVSYRWNEAGTEATLVEDAGENFTLAITDGGNPVPQTWRIPSRAECMTCHTPQAGHALSFNTRQLNLEGDMAGFTGNQLTTLYQNDFLTAHPGSPNLLPRHLGPQEDEFSVEARVRSYLAVNCAYCHKSGGTAPASWDGRPELLLAETGLVNGSATNNGGDPLNKLVVPGDTAHSIALHRISASNGFTRMPPLGSNVLDAVSIDLLTEWINGELAGRQDYAAWRAANFDPENDPSGDPDADPDADGASNRLEFLAGTDPHDGSSRLRPEFSADSSTLSFAVPVNRSFRVIASEDLESWTPLDIPGNQPLPTAGGLVEIVCPPAGERQFYRVELIEN